LGDPELARPQTKDDGKARVAIRAWSGERDTSTSQKEWKLAEPELVAEAAFAISICLVARASDTGSAVTWISLLNLTFR
jgi:hypothetical protein